VLYHFSFLPPHQWLNLCNLGFWSSGCSSAICIMVPLSRSGLLLGLSLISRALYCHSNPGINSFKEIIKLTWNWGETYPGFIDNIKCTDLTIVPETFQLCYYFPIFQFYFLVATRFSIQKQDTRKDALCLIWVGLMEFANQWQRYFSIIWTKGSVDNFVFQPSCKWPWLRCHYALPWMAWISITIPWTCRSIILFSALQIWWCVLTPPYDNDCSCTVSIKA